jgi:8-oxo-dGTP pyrophosphatase MutT (NUDIX family)
MCGSGFKGYEVTDLLRHVTAAAALRLPGHYRVLRLGADAVGFVTQTVVDALQRQGFAAAGSAVVIEDEAALARAQAGLAEAGLLHLRGEAFDVRAAPGGRVLGQVDRGALPVFGIAAEGVHVNGLVRGEDGWRVWIARRSPTKLLDPGKLDHIVAGGICAGMDAAETVVKEAGEEAGVPPELAKRARLAGVITYAIERPEGLRRDRLYCYDLELPPGFQPVPRDGEVESFSLMRLDDVLARVRDTDDFKFNVNLVLIQLFVRLGLADAKTFGTPGNQIGIA